jgi:hypothetical protein
MKNAEMFVIQIPQFLINTFAWLLSRVQRPIPGDTTMVAVGQSCSPTAKAIPSTVLETTC